MFKKFLLIQFLCLSFCFNSYGVYDNVREPVSWNENEQNCYTGNFSWDPLVSNNDVNWEFSNPVCVGFISGYGAAMVASSFITKALCVAKNPIGAPKSSAEQGQDPVPQAPIVNPSMAYRLFYWMPMVCATRTYEYGALQATATSTCASPGANFLCAGAQATANVALTDMTKCCAATASYFAVTGTAIAVLREKLYQDARRAFEDAKVCGSGWNNWKKFDVNGDEVLPTQDGQWRVGPYNGSYQKCIESIFVYNINSCNLPSVDGVDANEMSIKNKYFREYLYGGREYIDKGSGTCHNPYSWDSAQKIKFLGYNDLSQRYYMKGPGQAANFACHRFTDPKDESVINAQQCCQERSQRTMCIQMGNSYKFCEFGSRCEVSDIIFETYYAKSKSDYLCAKTYNVCPYNHLLGGGTEVSKYQRNSNGMPSSRVENYCQVMKHCQKLPVVPYVKISDLDGAVISSACRNLKGDTQNIYEYEIHADGINNVKSFSAPIAQCFKETVQNLLLNRAGSTRCRDADELPDADGICTSGYIYVQGQEIGSKSVFVSIQDGLRSAIKMVMTISIVFFGAKVLIASEPVQRKQIVPYIIKFAVIMYFALGTGWQNVFVDGVLETSMVLGNIVMRVDEDKPETKLDGCQFPRINSNLAQDDPNRFDNPQYPEGLGYLAMWDTLDCKLVRAIGFSPDVTVPYILLAMIAGFLTGGLGIVFLVAVASFGFFFFALILRALHIFLTSTIAIVILIYVSPIVITCLLFQKTKSIFDNWLKQMIGFILQPVILFAYMGIFIAIFESTIIGDVEFKGDGLIEPKQIICDSKTSDSSIYCIFRVASFKTFSGLEPIGIAIPILTSMNKERLGSIVKAALLMFIFSSFMDKISALASKLVGGSEISSQTPGVADMSKKAMSYGSSISTRGTRAMKSIGMAAAKKGYGKVKNAVGKYGNQGKSVQGEGVKKANDSAETRKPPKDESPPKE
jgi:type IV secretory pathway VirB6-like protein